MYKVRRAKDGTRVALDGVTLSIPRGELFGLLGPNGAGKTTLIKILTTLLLPTSGAARVAGHDVAAHPERVRRRINMVSGGETSGYGLLTVRENLWMFGQLYGLPSALTNSRIRALLDVVKMGDRLHTKAAELSTGLRQKMNIVRGFLTDPEVLFLDEPTLGLDVSAARDIRRFIRQWMHQHGNRTLLLTTHYMVEADELCDRVAIINGGRVLACDTPARLKQRQQRDSVFRLRTPAVADTAAPRLAGVPGVRGVHRSDLEGKTVFELTVADDGVLTGVFAMLEMHGIGVLTITKHEPTLEDVFVDLVGRSMEEVEGGQRAAAP
ncbi:MAG TPA: ABC transporter ATP-binding protein [Vicinamibacterales bacterium]|nr:ABC transporter ATP-binding protein [Vicinamibacterales bacterium]